MATLVWTNSKVVINSVDLSDHVKQVTLTYDAETQDETAHGQTNRKMKAGLTNWTLEVEFFQDFASGKVDATLFPLVGAAAFAITVNPVNAANSATNPQYQGNVILTTYPIMSGAIGVIATSQVKFAAASALTRATS